MATFRLSVTIIAATAIALGSFAQPKAPKHELRAGWLYTVWNLDWPPVKIDVNASVATRERQRSQQQQRLIYLLDQLKRANINTVFFQVRSCADAMYQSSFEPWSGWLVSSRGGDPGWDPLAFIITEAHKRGMALHAWIDPYRYETTAGMWNGSINPGYSVSNPDWIYTYDNFNILNPGKPEVRQRVVDVVRDIITRYDVDGIALNDYFYVNNGGKTDDRPVDYDLYLQMRESEQQSQDDWRRENVNRMVADVYDACIAEKPYLMVGVSPSGEMCTNQEMADEYGVDVCSRGWDWQYSYIFSEPLEWLRRKKVDYLFPQIYWTIGYEIEDFSVMCPWWQKALNRFGRHNYVKHSLDGLANVPKLPGNASTEATGPNSSEASEYVNEILLTRTSDWNHAPGQGFFKTSDITNTPWFIDYLVENAYPSKAIPPSAGWKPYDKKGIVTDIRLDGDTLRWNCDDTDVRYAVYVVSGDDETNLDNARTTIADPSHLLGIAFDNKLFVADKLDSDGHPYVFYVSILDRFWVEHSPAASNGSKREVCNAPLLIFPTNGERVSLPFNFRWNDDLTSTYRFEVAEDSEFSRPVWSVPLSRSDFPAVRLQMLTPDITYYWRVVAYSVGNPEVVSDVASFSVNSDISRITYPADGDTNIPTTPVVTWDGADAASSCRLQIAVNDSFGAPHIIIDTETDDNTVQIPQATLNTGRVYFARVIFNIDNVRLTSPVNRFVVENVVPDSPQFVTPSNDDDIISTDIAFELTPREGTAVYRIEIATSPTFPVRSTKILSFDQPSGIITQSKAGLKVNTTYYMRPSARYYFDGEMRNSEAGDAVKIFYRGENSVDGVADDVSQAEIEGYYNILGIKSSTPHSGLNILRFTDGSTQIVIIN